MPKTNFFEENAAFKWQKDLVSYLNNNNPDTQKILFMVDEKGNSGKTTLVKNTQCLFPGKKVFIAPPQDYDTLVSLFPDDEVDIVILDWSHNKKFDIPYAFLENLKDGSMVQMKHEVIKKDFPTPHVVVFMEHTPDSDALSKDRYVIEEIELDV